MSTVSMIVDLLIVFLVSLSLSLLSNFIWWNCLHLTRWSLTQFLLVVTWIYSSISHPRTVCSLFSHHLSSTKWSHEQITLKIFPRPSTIVIVISVNLKFIRKQSSCIYCCCIFMYSVCIGTTGRMSVPSNREHHFQNLRDRYSNCTYVDGNLELTWIENKDVDLTFLQNIREVTGYVLISHVDVKRIVLPNLQVSGFYTCVSWNIHSLALILFIYFSFLPVLVIFLSFTYTPC